MKPSGSKWKIPSLPIATQQLLQTGSKIFLHICFGALCVQAWFGIKLNLAVHLLNGSTFIDRFMRGIFPPEWKVGPRYSHTVSILDSTKHSKTSSPTITVVSTPSGKTSKTVVEVAETPNWICTAHQALLIPHTECHVVAATSVFGIHTVYPRILDGTRQLTFAAHDVSAVSLSKLFNIFTFDVFAKAMQLPKQKLVAFATEPPASAMTASSSTHHNLPTEILKSLEHFALRNNNVDFRAEWNTALCNALQVKHDSFHNFIGVVHYKPRTNREL